MKKIAILSLVTFLLMTITPALLADAALYKAKCAMCHGANGEGKAKSPSLTTDAVKKLTDAQLTDVIANGKGKASHAFKAKGLTDAQIQSLVTFIRGLK